MGKTFQKIHGCSVGSFEGNADMIPQWIRANGGSYSKDMNSDVTHLIITKEAYKKNVEAGNTLYLLPLAGYIGSDVALQYERRSD